MHEFLIVGGGVIGLSLSWELLGHGKSVCVVDRDVHGKGTSWVGAGIFPPPQTLAVYDPLEQLRLKSHALHLEWSQRLLDETGIDNELHECGGIYFARSAGEAASLCVAMERARQDGVVVEELTSDQFGEYEPRLKSELRSTSVAYRLPEEMQLRSPRHLKALTKACTQRGVELRTGIEVTELRICNQRVEVVADGEQLPAEQICLCGGPWTVQLLESLGIVLPVEPWRGQLILWKTDQPLLSHVVNEGHRYLVPRKDGHMLAGATMEDVGFDCRTTEEAIDALRAFSCELLPELADRSIEQAWAGLRPKTPDGRPFLGRVPGTQNLSVAAGHFRSGLHLSPATAVFMAQLLLDDTLQFDLAPFRLNR